MFCFAPSRQWTLLANTVILMASVIMSMAVKNISATRASQAGNVSDYVLLREFQDLKLNCTTEKGGLSFTWTKDKVDLSKANMTKFHVNNTDTKSVLTIDKANSTDTGNYECVKNNVTIVKQFVVRPKPRVKFNITHYERGQMVWLGSTWRIGCQFANAFYAREAQINMVRCETSRLKQGDWCGRANEKALLHDMDKWIEKNSKRVRIDTIIEDGSKMLFLTINRAHYRDIAYYLCLGSSLHEHANTTMMLRVRDSSNYVWPMALFTALALYLFSLVTIFETRRIRATSFLKLEWDNLK